MSIDNVIKKAPFSNIFEKGELQFIKSCIKTLKNSNTRNKREIEKNTNIILKILGELKIETDYNKRMLVSNPLLFDKYFTKVENLVIKFEIYLDYLREFEKYTDIEFYLNLENKYKKFMKTNPNKTFLEQKYSP